ncbi:flagellar hook-associated protein FlgL [Pseudomonas sp. GOM6]|uniref:flagellar hook-associated protein FlgL n=1 Tax=Pseudomonas sp. GOM6 TaxID=3036944 RepID=UPI00240A3694|nr:flagellar hook-associated protein FlgL [Pseudomonas sp. GOM6]MDG1580348.1 flagellar hook-associated protein FlgL [Pseudomonas sp. GOM6]
MRISSVQAFNNGVQGLQRNYSNVTRTQEQISTGNRILTPADDPVASVRLLQLEQQQNVLNQYADNLTAATNSLTQEESTLNAVNNILQRVRELAVQSGDGALSQADRQSMALELREREDELFALFNSRNARGEYLFAGHQGKTQPFVRDAAGNYSYVGDEGQRELQIASSLSLPINDNGKKLFENIINAGRLNSLQVAPPAPLPPLPPGSTLSASAPLVQDEVAFSAAPPNNFPGAGIGIHFTSATDYIVYDLAATPVFPVAGPPFVDPNVLASGQLDDDPDSSDQLVFRGVSVQLDGVPLGTETFAVTLDPTQQKQGILSTIKNLRTALESTADTPAGNLAMRDAVAEVLTNLDHGMTAVDLVRGEIGARLNVIESTQTDNEEVSLVNKAVQADLRELDYAEALSRLSFQSIILEAAQQSFVKISGLNLFNQLR